ncbi:MAG: type IV pilus assembly protein PilM [Candidatus Paceibacterota bacterium]
MEQKESSGIAEKILSPFARFLDRGGKSVIGIDVGASSIKVVQVRKKAGKAVLETYGEIALGPYANLAVGQATRLKQDKIREALDDLLREANVTSRSGGFAVPLRSSFVTVIEVMNVSEKELKEVVEIEARKYIPMPIREVTLDWNPLPLLDENGEVFDEHDGRKSHAKTRQVLIAAIHNEAISAFSSLAQSAKLSISFLEIEVFSLIRSLLHRERAPVLLVDMGAGSTKLAVVEGGVARRTHTIDRGSQDMTIALSRSQGLSIVKAEERKREIGLSKDPKYKDTADSLRFAMRDIFAQANKLLLQYEKQYNRTISKVVLSGGGSLVKGVVEMASNNFSAEVVYADPFSRVETPAFLDPTLKSIGPNFSVSLGVALRKLEEEG